MVFIPDQGQNHPTIITIITIAAMIQQKNAKKRNSKKLTTIKSLDFIVLPPILVIHLSRFYYDLTKKKQHCNNLSFDIEHYFKER